MRRAGSAPREGHGETVFACGKYHERAPREHTGNSEPRSSRLWYVATMLARSPAPARRRGRSNEQSGLSVAPIRFFGRKQEIPFRPPGAIEYEQPATAKTGPA